MIVQISNTGACYGVAKCAEIVFEREKTVKDEDLQVLDERMKTINPDENNSITEKKEEISRRMNKKIIKNLLKL